MRRFHDEEEGAVFMLCLAGILILVLLALVIFDTGFATRDKARTQSAADFSALSQASIKARSMNMLAYSNIAKRSIWAVHSLYPSHVYSLRKFVADGLSRNCDYKAGSWYEPSYCSKKTAVDENCRRCQKFITYRHVFEWETKPGSGVDEFSYFSGGNYSNLTTVPAPPLPGGFPSFSALSEWIDEYNDYLDTDKMGVIRADPQSNTIQYHAHDLRALDNYQRYLVGATPWWAWLEHQLTAVRNGATAAASYPLPEGKPLATSYGHSTIGTLSGQSMMSPVGAVDRLPVSPPNNNQAMQAHIRTKLEPLTSLSPSALYNRIASGSVPTYDPFLIEHLFNNALLIARSRGIYQDGCLNPGSSDVFCAALRKDSSNAPLKFIDNAATSDFLRWGLKYSQEAFGRVAEPWLMQRFPSRSHWLSASSNIVFTYRTDHEDFRGDMGREKYTAIGDDPMETGQFFEGNPSATADYRTRQMFSALGYWAMARSEITFSASDIQEPDLWHPLWTAKLRPVSLPNEFNQQSMRMSQVYSSILPSFQIADELQITDFAGIDHSEHRWDFARMNWMMRGMSESTIDGVSK